MATVHFAPNTQKDSVEIGDVFQTDAGFFRLIEIEHGQYALNDIETAEVVSNDLKHFAHVINHVKKHYGGYALIKNDRIVISIN